MNQIKTILKDPNPMTVAARQHKRGLILPLELLVFILVFLVTQLGPPIFLSAPISLLAVFLMVASPAAATELTFFLSGEIPDLFITMLSLLLTALWTIAFCMLIQKRNPGSMGFVKKDFALQYLKGLLCGFLLFSGVVLTGVLLGGFRFEGLMRSSSPVMILLYFIFFLIQGMEEEILCRGYLMISVSRRSPMPVAVIANAALFALAHIFNPGIEFLPLFNIMLFGLFASFYMLRTGNIWGVGAVHSVWNFMQGNFYGLPVSGMDLNRHSVFRFSQTGSDLISGGAFGPEGGLPVTFVCLIGILLVLFLPLKKQKQPRTV